MLNDDRTRLYERINKRVDTMVKNGLVNEVKCLLDMGYSKDLISMQAIGYKEMIEFINGEISLDNAIELIKQNTRHFAKRQLTWFRREKEVTMINYNDFNYDKKSVLKFMIDMLKEKNIYEDKK